MSSEFEDARRSLNDLPESAQKAKAINLLAEIEEAEKLKTEALNKLEFAAPSPHKNRDDWLLSGLIGLLAIAALYTGIDAIWNAEYCSRSRSGSSCTRGLRAQLQGGATVAIALLLGVVPVPACKVKVAVSWLLGITVAILFMASLFV
ncbi:hypothetical protein KUF54_05830 [Comamonas sp. Y33R10-2]|uniref:hypothetical protein n=1 Tax=Comamonas sp. Y33R10-2 TaxID=2853257 RepID=UPI001C5CB6BE|nr:hypothetical protein [Comamonas sp. Y33R10-2]QXZ10726.1 hypothetical protein KUF54_05830 [Comamonas sp. Y33R10-2]